ncbi:hypothetical protein FQZ97_1018410 [compost metagenome]
MAQVIDQNASMLVERRGTVRQHAGAYRWEWIEGLWLRRCRTLTGSQAPVKAPKGDTSRPGQQRVSTRCIIHSLALAAVIVNFIVSFIGKSFGPNTA